MKGILKIFLLVATSVLYFNCTSSKSKISETKELQDFEIAIRTTGDGIVMEGKKGTAWKDLSFSINDLNKQAIDEYGMTNLKKTSEIKNEGLADFLITIQTEGDDVILKGIDGTAWTELTVMLPESGVQLINQYGTSIVK